jgi:hypothetical protein
MRRRLPRRVRELLAVLLDAVSVPYEDHPKDYRVREDLLNARLADVRFTLQALLDNPRANVRDVIALQQQWIADLPVSYTPYPGGLDDEWEGE